MKNIFRLLTIFLIAFAVRRASAQMSVEFQNFGRYFYDITYAPLLLFKNGQGYILPYDNGKTLQVGRNYVMTAIPARGYAFTNWNPVEVVTVTGEEIDVEAGATIPISYTDVTPEPGSEKDSSLVFTVKPETIYNAVYADTFTGKVYQETITESTGWQANFVPSDRSFGR